jgi:DNA repair/transcription protein MET18/MMS19
MQVQYALLPAPSLAMTFRQIFKEIHVQSLPQLDRRNVFNMFSHILNARLQGVYQTLQSKAVNYLHPDYTDVKAMQGDFVLGFIQAMDGEKDPRNLLIAYRCVVLIATYCDLGVFTEELFEVISCYFPIEFNPVGVHLLYAINSFMLLIFSHQMIHME